LSARTLLRPLEFETHYKAALAFTLVSRCFPWSDGADAFRTAAVMIREPEKKKEQEKRRPPGKVSPWS
jgi:hypothetical protein